MKTLLAIIGIISILVIIAETTVISVATISIKVIAFTVLLTCCIVGRRLEEKGIIKFTDRENKA